MRALIRPLAAILPLAALVLCSQIAVSDRAFSQAATGAQPQPPVEQPPLKQIALTEKQIQDALAATAEMDAVTEKLPENAKPDAKLTGELDAAAKKNGFADYAQYTAVVDNISLVLGGFDPATKKYVGPEAVIKAQIALLQADTKMPAKDKKEALADLNEALKSLPPPVENKGNIELVAKYYDKLISALGDDQE